MRSRRSSSRQQIDIKEVKDGVLQLHGGRYRAILQSSAVNFELKSEAERDTLVEAYQSFLNSLSCPIQVVVRTRELDMDKYLENLALSLAIEQEVIYRTQLQNYSEFVSRLVVSNKILTRHFYVVIPYDAKDTHPYDAIMDQLNLRCDIVVRGLSRMGMQVRKLSSVEALDLFYSFYSPEQSRAQPLTALTLKQVEEAII